MATKKKSVTQKVAAKRVQKAIRSRKLREDANLEKTLGKLADTVGIPRESLRVQYPSGRKFDIDLTVGHLRKAWDK